MRTQSLNANKYYITFIDDFNRMCWVYFLKQKSNVPEEFWKLKYWIKNQSGLKKKEPKSDNEIEYTSNMFNKFCQGVGIEHQLITTYTP